MTASTGVSYSWNFPVVMTASGLQPQSTDSLNSQLISNVSSTNPGYTVLPAGLIEDVASTQVAGISLCDQAKVELVNSLTPYGANLFLLGQLGAVYGVYQGQPTNTSVLVVFSGTIGYVIPNGFLVGDGANVYTVQGGTIIGAGGTSPSVTAVSVNSGIFSVPANTVTQLLTSVPATVTLSVNNPTAGTPGTGSETVWSYRSRVLQAGLAASVGTGRYIKTLLGQVTGVTQVACQQAASGGIRVIVGGSADTYEIAYAIFQSVADPSELVGSAVNSSRNVTVGINDFPDNYSIVYVNAPVQTVTMSITWNTVLSGFTGGNAFASLVQQPLANYINALGIGQVINVFVMNQIFQSAVEDVLDSSLLTKLVFSVSINGTVTPPATGTGAISGDAESYFSCATSGITVTQG